MATAGRAFTPPTIRSEHQGKSTSFAYEHPWAVRFCHWVNAIALLGLIGSGLRIFRAFPSFGPKIPQQNLVNIPNSLTLGGWLGGARHWHFAAMWLLALNGVVYIVFLALHGDWRHVTPHRGDHRAAWEMIRFYLFARPDHPHQGKHNALQRLTYFAMPILGVVLVLSGLAIWKPVTLGAITALFGSYATARFVHFAAMVLLLALAAVHVFMVFAVDPYALRAMVTGWYDATRSPEARNARPFYHLFARGEPAPAAVPAPSLASPMSHEELAP